MKLSFEREPLDLKELREMLEIFDQAGIELPQDVKDTLFHVAARGFAVPEEKELILNFIREVKSSERDDTRGGDKNS